ncbi:HIT family protein [Paenibacillus agaridevorans]|uniref:HIT family protein n=1 Tax=Paenibacillus agaridevorans TaxID=171404 RepID=UPI001FE90469|nr:HIT family protein [Paenibacillus agaridevorans]
MKLRVGFFIAWIIPYVFLVCYNIGFFTYIITNAKGLNEINRMGIFVFMWFVFSLVLVFGAIRIIQWYKQGKFHIAPPSPNQDTESVEPEDAGKRWSSVPEVPSCLGCRLANGLEEAHVVFENDYVTCLLDIDPLNEGHTLILPKLHFVELADTDISARHAIMNASVRISNALKTIYKPDGISIMQNGGSFNDLGHYHMHVFPRYNNDGFGWKEPDVKSQHSLDAVKQRIAEQLKDGMPQL